MLDVVQKGVYDRCYCRLLQSVFVAYNEDTTIRTNRNENRKREDKNDK